MALASSTWLADALLPGVGTVESQATRVEGAATRGLLNPDHLADAHDHRRCRTAARATPRTAKLMRQLRSHVTARADLVKGAN